jgi:GntR family transcriptional regulator, transcriptional repressor for pyruvate dehydrogenase complex
MRSTLAGTDAVGSGHLYEGNRLFHSAIIEASGNRLLAVVAEPVYGVLRTHVLRDAAPVEFWRRVADDHDEILAAIERGDGDAAAAAMRAHLVNLRATYLSVYRQPDNDTKE